MIKRTNFCSKIFKKIFRPLRAKVFGMNAFFPKKKYKTISLKGYGQTGKTTKMFLSTSLKPKKPKLFREIAEFFHTDVKTCALMIGH